LAPHAKATTEELIVECRFGNKIVAHNATMAFAMTTVAMLPPSKRTVMTYLCQLMTLEEK
jgi:hypothetical protein